MLKLILPVIFPSWRFFSNIEASPRLEFSYLKDGDDDFFHWQAFRPIPERISLFTGFKRLFWNPEWNETLYINTCAERLFEGYSEMRDQEIMQRIKADILAGKIRNENNARYVTYRLIALVRTETGITRQVTFTAKPRLITDAC